MILGKGEVCSLQSQWPLAAFAINVDIVVLHHENRLQCFVGVRTVSINKAFVRMSNLVGSDGGRMSNLIDDEATLCAQNGSL